MTNNQKSSDDSKNKTETDAIAKHIQIALSELLFAVLPLLVLILAFFFGKKNFSILSTPEWAFCAAILFGQSLIRLVRSSAETESYIPEAISLLASLILVIGLVPSLVILSIFLITSQSEIGLALIIGQFLLFTASIGTYLLCAWMHAIGESRRANLMNKNPKPAQNQS